jgi:tetratricopeptide (TPR) repeat protein
MSRVVAFLALALALVSAPVSQAARQDALGRIDFPTSQTGPAQQAFVRGVLLLHSFEYDDAKEAFQEAQKAAPDFAMAYWGEAMTYNHPLWAQTAPDLARAALTRLAPTPEARLAKAGTEKERDWLRAVEALYGAGDKLARDLAHAGQLARMHEKYPDDLEVTAFYALALLGTSHGGRDFAIYMRAAALADEVYSKNPQHPGATHYLIHAFDDPVHAPLGLKYAVAYGRMAPAASHALHMPTHIYFALGMWDEANEMNERSYKAADERVARKSLAVDDRGFHALLWLTYGYLQQGRQVEAKSILDQIEAAAAKSGSVRTKSHLALARAAWLIETRRWADARPTVNPEGLGPGATAADLFATGMAAFRSGNRAAGHEALKRIAMLVGDGDQPLRTVTSSRPAPARPSTPARPGVRPIDPAPAPAPGATHAGHAGSPGQPQTGLPAAGAGDRRVAAVMAQQLEAVLIFVEGRRDEAIVLARQAAAVEDSLSFEFGPPLPVKPGHELVADLLMDARRPGEALPEYEAVLKRYPGRTLSLLGVHRAATAARQADKAQRAAAELRKIWQRADKTLPELREILTAPTSSER